jgi:hypothetical protein
LINGNSDLWGAVTPDQYVFSGSEFFFVVHFRISEKDIQASIETSLVYFNLCCIGVFQKRVTSTRLNPLREEKN